MCRACAPAPPHMQHNVPLLHLLQAYCQSPMQGRCLTILHPTFLFNTPSYSFVSKCGHPALKRARPTGSDFAADPFYRGLPQVLSLWHIHQSEAGKLSEKMIFNCVLRKSAPLAYARCRIVDKDAFVALL